MMIDEPVRIKPVHDRIVQPVRTRSTMRTLLLLSLCLLLSAPHLRAQDVAVPDSTGLPGDNFSLQGALELFKNSPDLESFEKALNTETNKVNNLDLDQNGDIDYVRVMDHVEGDAHAIALQVAISATETQDVAVIELEKTAADKAIVQIRGDEDMYGAETIMEPSDQKEEVKDTKGPAAPELVDTWVEVNVWGWPGVQWCFGTGFMLWESPWYWDYYPPWWRPWRHCGWHTWWGYTYHYHHWYHPAYGCRVVHAHQVYVQHRRSSPVVHERYERARQQHAATRPMERPANERPMNKGKGVKNPRPTHVQRPPARTSPTARPAKGNGRTGRPAQGGKAKPSR